MEDLNRLTRTRFNQKKLGPAQNRQQIGESVSESTVSKSSKTGGIASPLTEDVSLRTIHTEVHEVRSLNGLNVYEYQNYSSLTFADALFAEAKFNLGDPDA